jgi:hypothetical protein
MSKENKTPANGIGLGGSSMTAIYYVPARAEGQITLGSAR